MSYQAQNTFGLLYVGGVSRKAVLQACGNYADDEMRVFAKTRTLAKDTDQSLDTARRRLHELEDLGVLVRFPQWVDDDGKVNKEGRGRRISDEIRLIPTVKQDDIDARAKAIGLRWRKDDDDDPDEVPDGDPGPSNLRGPSSGAAVAIEPVAPSNLQGPAPSNSEDLQGRPLHCGKGLNESLTESQKDSPPTPQGGCELQQIADQGSEAKQWPHAESWSRFEGAWQEPILRQSIARNVWSGLTDDEQAAAIKAAKGYVLHRRAQKKPPNVIGAHTFLRERDAWPGYAKLVPPEPVNTRKLLCGSDEWQALQVIRRVAGFSPMTGDAAFSGDVPAGAAALAAYFLDGMSDTENWVALEAKQGDGRDDKRFIAWRQRAHEWLRMWIEPERIYVEPKGQETGVLHMPDGTERRYRKFVMGLVVPSEWPPAKHGDPSHPS